MNPFEPPANSRKIEIKEGNVVHTPDSFLALVSAYKRQNPVKYAIKEASFKKEFEKLGGKPEDFKLKVVKSREELEAELAELKAKLGTEPVETEPVETDSSQEESRPRGRPKKEE